MLQFFRKYQKVFFYVVAFVIIFSFVFSGAVSTFIQNTEVRAKKIAKTFTGKDVTDRELAILNHLINYGQDSLASAKEGHFPNLLNDGVFLHDFLETGYAQLIFDKYADLFKDEIVEKIASAKAYKPFVHPKAAFIRQEEIWKTYNPLLLVHLNELKKVEAGDYKAGFKLLLSLFKDQQVLPAMAVQRVLYLQQNQYPDLSKDIDIANRDFSLFGFHTLEDWFGKRFVSALSWTLLNGESAAKKQGIFFEKKEIQSQLFNNVFSGFKKFTEEKNITEQVVASAYNEQKNQIGLSDAELIDAWNNVAAFRKLLKKCSEQIFMDSLIQQTFQAYADEGIDVDVFELPHTLRFKTFSEVAEFEAYAESVFDKKEACNLLGPIFKVEEIKKRAPELVYHTYKIEMKEVDVEKLLQRVSLKQLLDWQLEDKNWELLQKNFPYVIHLGVSNLEDKISLLDNLQPSARDKIDSFAKNALVQAHPEWIEESLLIASPKTQTLHLSFKTSQFLFKGAKNSAEVIEKLSAIYASKEAKDVSFDNKHFYRVEVLEFDEQEKLMSYSMAKNQKVLKEMVSAKLSLVYPDVRRKNAYKFQNPDGTWKAVSEVASELYPYAYPDLIKKLVGYAKKMDPSFNFDAATMPMDLLAKYRLYEFVETQRSKNKGSSDEDSPNQKEFELIKTSTSLTRASPIISDDLFGKEIGFVSEVKAFPGGSLGFMKVIKASSTKSNYSKHTALKNALCEEMERKEFSLLLNKLSDEQILSGIR